MRMSGEISKEEFVNTKENLDKQFVGFQISKGEAYTTELDLEAVIECLERVLRCTVVEDIETDDRLVIEAYNRPDRVIAGCDKDYYGCPVNIFNVDKPESGIVKGNTFGQLWIDDKRKVGGYGRQFLYWQVASGDSSDNYKANSASEKSWGDVAAFDALKECSNDKESWAALAQLVERLS